VGAGGAWIAIKAVKGNSFVGGVALCEGFGGHWITRCPLDVCSRLLLKIEIEPTVCMKGKKGLRMLTARLNVQGTDVGSGDLSL
jgi:hypothetical protein